MHTQSQNNQSLVFELSIGLLLNAKNENCYIKQCLELKVSSLKTQDCGNFPNK